MLLVASLLFWFVVIVGGGSCVILVVGALFGADDFVDAFVFTFMLAGAVALLWVIGTSGHWLMQHHV